MITHIINTLAAFLRLHCNGLQESKHRGMEAEPEATTKIQARHNGGLARVIAMKAGKAGFILDTFIFF